MPILPIDLQTMFSNLNQISKEQSLAKDVPPSQQVLVGQQLVKKTEEGDSTVNLTKEVGEGVEQVSEEEKKKNEKERKKKGKKKGSDTINEEGKEVVKDPLLGHHVDISG